MAKSPILIVSGTNRPNANALKVARIVQSQYRAAGLQADLFSLAEMPQEIFNPTSYAEKPPAFVAIQEKILAARGLHIVSPEYNGSFPGVLKYFIDMLKFPESFDAKPVAFVGESNGATGAVRPVEHLQQIFGYRNAHIFPERVFIPGVKEKVSAAGQITDAGIAERLQRQAARFASYARHMHGCPRT